jgi:hypothetical protein
MPNISGYKSGEWTFLTEHAVLITCLYNEKKIMIDNKYKLSKKALVILLLMPIMCFYDEKILYEVVFS